MIKPEIKEAVKILYVEKGYSPAEIAKLTRIDHSTVYDWIRLYRWKDERTNKQFKLTAEQLVNIPAKPVLKQMEIIKKKACSLIKAGYKQKEAARLVGVSEKTMSQWCKKYKWKAAEKY